ncbi:MAG: pseudouridine synthase [Clostridia bacterium]|nr:pseudouridine synthase [Clostridia bacterium]
MGQTNLRLDKLIASQCGLSRKEARLAIRSGRVQVNGESENNIAKSIYPEKDQVMLDGQAVYYKKHLYLLMNKPAGVLSASNDAKRQTVVDLVPEKLRRDGHFPVGRLDKDTTGLLIITDDGDFAHEVIAPKKRVPKSYLVQLDGILTEEMPEKFRQGIVLADGTPCRPAKLEILAPDRARLILCEGKYHEVKRMFGTVGLGVVSLHRESLGDLFLPDELKPGETVEMDGKMVLSAKSTGQYTF